ncbi:MAG: hypothetical protein DI586_03630 [Micavibrio aeruginosavorus]|uniref:Uncharacterized protein n=1 Tax=Micavibrio aeruginosavorus TaxID=349221 RepID=A0A2W5FN27_9BACT|nr:MAG: hypothetical protein DI586_03630 [Micavibrio aeruginosavorus]
MTPIEEQPVADDLAPTSEAELILEPEKEEDEEGGEGEGGKKSGGNGGKKPALPSAQLLQDEDNLDDYDSETLIEKLKMLVWAPFSTMVPGASSFESEQDLKRILFLGQIGLITNQIHPADIADPDLIKKLEQRHQMRQEIFKAEIAAATSGNAAGLAAGLMASTPPPEAQQKREQKQQAAQVREVSSDARREAEGKRPDVEQKTQTPVVKQDPLAPEAETSYFAKEQDQGDFARTEAKADSSLDTGVVIELLENANDQAQSSPLSSPGILGALAGAFNLIAQQAEYTAPEQKIEFRFADPAPKMDVSGPMGGA